MRWIDSPYNYFNSPDFVFWKFMINLVLVFALSALPSVIWIYIIWFFSLDDDVKLDNPLISKEDKFDMKFSTYYQNVGIYNLKLMLIFTPILMILFSFF